MDNDFRRPDDPGITPPRPTDEYIRRSPNGMTTSSGMWTGLGIAALLVLGLLMFWPSSENRQTASRDNSPRVERPVTPVPPTPPAATKPTPAQ
jgi:hypothetical protein